MDFYNATDFTGTRPWDAMSIGLIEGASIRLHWSDQPYIWHVNDGAEVFVVLEGEVTMKYRTKTEIGATVEREQLMVAGNICFANHGDEHVAHPNGPARILVIEKAGSI